MAMVAAGARADDRVTLELQGTVAERCTIDAMPGMDEVTVDLASSGTSTIDFEIDCNEPMRFSVRAANGAFVNDSAIEYVSTDFTKERPYSAQFRVVATGSTVAGSSTALEGGVAGDTNGDIPFDTRGELTVSWSTDGRRLVGGTYAETITITVETDDRF